MQIISRWFLFCQKVSRAEMLYTVAAIDKVGNEVYYVLVLELINTQ